MVKRLKQSHITRSLRKSLSLISEILYFNKIKGKKSLKLTKALPLPQYRELAQITEDNIPRVKINNKKFSSTKVALHRQTWTSRMIKTNGYIYIYRFRMSNKITIYTLFIGKNDKNITYLYVRNFLNIAYIYICKYIFVCKTVLEKNKKIIRWKLARSGSCPIWLIHYWMIIEILHTNR